MAKRDFHIGDILSITTDRLVSPRHVDGIYDILNFLTGDNLFTHQLPRAVRECKPHLLRQHPQLKDVAIESIEALPEEWTREQREAAVNAWLSGAVKRFGETLPVEPIPADDHERKDPWDELVIMRGTDEGIVPVVVKPADEQ